LLFAHKPNHFLAGGASYWPGYVRDGFMEKLADAFYGCISDMSYGRINEVTDDICEE
jgi:hypothetical protein